MGKGVHERKQGRERESERQRVKTVEKKQWKEFNKNM
jgi:hypothetical protein